MNRLTPFISIALGGALAWLSNGCAVVPKIGPSENETSASAGRDPAAWAPALAGGGSNAGVRLRPGLVVGIKVMVAGHEEIIELGKRVSDEGVISLPLVGDTDALGSTPGELARRLEAAYRAFFINPQVLVDVARDERPDAVSPWGSVTVLGTVRTPGRIAIPPTRDLRVSGAIQRAGGFDASARKNAIRVTRQSPDGTCQARQVNLEAVGQRGELEQDLLLEPNDVVFVQERVF